MGLGDRKSGFCFTVNHNGNSSHRRLVPTSGNVCALYRFPKGLVLGTAVSPGDVAADHSSLSIVRFVICPVEGEVAQSGELSFIPVEPSPRSPVKVGRPEGLILGG